MMSSMEVTTVSSLVASGDNNSNNNNNNNDNTNSNSNTNNNGNNNNQLTDKDNTQQTTHFIMSTKSIISNHISSPFTNQTTGMDVTDSNDFRTAHNANILKNPPIFEATNNTTTNSMSTDSDLSREVVEIVDRLISEIEQETQISDQTSQSTVHAQDEINSCPVRPTTTSMSPEVPLNPPLPDEMNDQQTNQLQDLSPDEGTCDLIIDADIPSNESQDDTPKADPDPETNEESHHNQSQESSTSTTTITTTATNTAAEANSRPEEKEHPQPGGDLPSNPNNQAKIAEELPAETEKPLEQEVKITLVSEEEQSPIPAVDQDDLQEDKTKDIVTLRNLEITPPPQPVEEQSVKEKTEDIAPKKEVQGSKRKRSSVSESTTESNQVSESGRSKRQRTQTKLFQVGEIKPEPQSTHQASISKKRKPRPSISRTKKKSIAPSVSDKDLSDTQNYVFEQPVKSQDVIFYEKNDYLAVRNEENTFYLCQLAENVKVDQAMMKIRWLDTKDEGKTYFLTSHRDEIFQKSIIMPVIPNISKKGKKGEQIFSLDDQVKANIADRLSKSLSAPPETVSSQVDEEAAL